MKIKTAQRSKKVILELHPRESGLPPASVPEVNLNRVLVPVDFSAASRKALDYAIAFARQFNAELVLLHVVETLPPPSQSFLLESGALDTRTREEAAKHLARWRDEIPRSLHSKAVVRDHTSAAHEIVTAATDNNADLIILGTQGRGGLAHLLIGSTAERVVRHAPFPVLVVRDRETDFVRPDRTRTEHSAPHDQPR